VGNAYGYAASGKGHIDSWRGLEFPALVQPTGSRNSTDNKDQMVYLDYAGSALPAKSQLDAILSNTSILANPHSTGPAASKTALLIEQATKLVIDHFNGEPGRLSGLDNIPSNCHPNEIHPGYEVVFTSGATDALRIVAEFFFWTNCEVCGSSSKLLYGHNSHTSVVGMRGSALASCAQYQCRHLDDICDPDAFCLEDLTSSEKECQCRHQNLLVVSAECNFGGDRPNTKSIVRACRESSEWATMIDFSKAASTSVVDLKDSDPDFACVSFYKLFGEPTGLGALFVRRPAIGKLNMEDDMHRYFGGGSVDVVCPNLPFKVSRRQPSLLASLKNGTVHYRGIVSLINGFNELYSLGGMAAINQHSMCIATEFVSRLRELRHRNGKPAVVIYGVWAKDNVKEKGPTVSFNCLRSDGSYVGYNEVSKLAELHDPPLQLRTGCFCNPGACQEALGLNDEDVKNNYLINGHVCGDHIDLVKGKPTGAIRASFGKDNLWEDMDYLFSFLLESFVDSHDSCLSGVAKPSVGVVEAELMEMYIYPIKSCAAQRVNKWSLDSETGRLAFDREFALVDSSGSAMRLQRYPQMSQIQPRVDVDSLTMRISAPGFDDLIMKLGDEESCVKSKGAVQVCGNSCGGQLWGDYESSQWFSRYLGVQCWLARHINDSVTYPNRRQSHAAFANEEPILLISGNAVDALNLTMEKQGQGHVQTKHFRPNIVVSVSEASFCSESIWKIIKHDRSEVCFQNVGECARCSMVDVDPTTGLKGKTLRALSEHNRRNGRITFGIFLRASDETTGYDGELCEGDIFFCQ
jgi:molybdenum cofactor sulfurtransferase